MATYMIGYDLNRPRGETDYADLVARIKDKFPTYLHNLDSTWLVVTTMSAEKIRDLLSPYLDSGDELLVAGLTGEGAWQGFSQRASTWLKNNL